MPLLPSWKLLAPRQWPRWMESTPSCAGVLVYLLVCQIPRPGGPSALRDTVKYMNRSQVLLTLLEEIAGAAAIVYHRTGAHAFTDPTGEELSGKAIPENIITQGFAEGKKGMYGSGIYATYKLTSQWREYMATYGEYLVKCRVNLQGYIILDYVEARKVYGEMYPLRDQLRQYYPTQWMTREFAWIDTAHEQMTHHPRVKTSKLALELSKEFHIEMSLWKVQKNASIAM
jgi:hypothetical protein